MTDIHIGGITDVRVRRNLDEYGDVILTVQGEDGTRVSIGCGRFYDDAMKLETLLDNALGALRNETEYWQDLPDEQDGYVADDRDGYYVSLDGKSWNWRTGQLLSGSASSKIAPLPTRDIAEYELACAMAETGYFPNVWYDDNSINLAVRKYHDAGGDRLLPLQDVNFLEDEAAIVDSAGKWDIYIVKDWGALGIMYVLQGDDQYRFTRDRECISKELDAVVPE